MWPNACHSHITRPVLTSISCMIESLTTPWASRPCSSRLTRDRVRRRRSRRCPAASAETRAGRRGSRCRPPRARSAGRRCCRSHPRPGRIRARGPAPATRSARSPRRRSGAEVRRRRRRLGSGVEPDEVAGLVDDHRPRGAAPLIGSEEEVPGRRAGLRGGRDPHRSTASAPAPRGSAGRRRRCPDGCGNSAWATGAWKATVKWVWTSAAARRRSLTRALTVTCSPGRTAVRRQEALAGAGRVGLERAVVAARAEPTTLTRVTFVPGPPRKLICVRGEASPFPGNGDTMTGWRRPADVGGADHPGAVGDGCSSARGQVPAGGDQCSASAGPRSGTGRRRHAHRAGPH